MTIATCLLLVLAALILPHCIALLQNHHHHHHHHRDSIVPLVISRSRNPALAMTDDSQETPQRRTPLDATIVWNHVNHVLDQVNPNLAENLGISLRPVNTDWKDTFKSENNDLDAPLYFCLEIVNDRGTTGDDKKKDEISSFVSFSVGYSTWEGLCVFVDELGPADGDANDNRDQQQLLWLQLLAKIAVRLGSRRLTWKRRYPPHPSWYHNQAVGPPDILDELHILHMDQAAMKAYVNYDSNEPSSTTASLDRSSVEVQSHKAILESSSDNNGNKFSVRLARANNLQDAQAMERLVQGLAIYVKEPLEDIHCDASDYLIDGSCSSSNNHPLYYSFLLEANDDDNCKEEEKQPCGIAVVYFGYSHQQGGRYLYLEDLYVEEAHQHKGAGSLCLKVLTRLALLTSCYSFQWLALDWNQPALELYQNKMGAKILEGKKVTRYTDTKLKEFANGFSTTLAGMMLAAIG